MGEDDDVLSIDGVLARMDRTGNRSRLRAEHQAHPGRAGTRVRLAPGVRYRQEAFGGVAYVPSRDHFFALDPDHAAVVGRLEDGWRPVDVVDLDRLVALAEVGVCATDPVTDQRAFYGRSQIGRLARQPGCSTPLVVNCFATAHCPLRCVYCHADDLMGDYRDGEDEQGLKEVIRVAAATPAMVGVVTGGEPLTRPERAERLIRELATDKAVVLDTSGVGDFARLVPTLRRYGVHVRVSLDSADRSVNDGLRPINRRYLLPGVSSSTYALQAIRTALGEGIPCSVQTVVTARNGDLANLILLRDKLVDLGVTTWALHIVVPAGKAAAPSRMKLRAGATAVDTLSELVRQAASERVPLDIRVTSTDRTPNSVLLINSKGQLCVESPDSSGKIMFTVPRVGAQRRILRQFRDTVDAIGHTGRYLNGALDLVQQTSARPTLASAGRGGPH